MTRRAPPPLKLEDLEQGRLEAGSFNHEGHVYLAWLYLQRYPLNEAIQRFSAALKRLTLKLGVPGKYHETITWFFMLIIAERRSDDSGQDWGDFYENNADLFSRDDNILNRYYSKDALDSDNARKNFILPDRLVA